MGITDADGKWDVTPSEGTIQNLETGEIKKISHIPSAAALAGMSYSIYMKKVNRAFYSGKWPPHICGYCKSEYY